MSYRYVLEMVCDWNIAAKSIKNSLPVTEYYNKIKDKMIIHDRTKSYIEGFALNYYRKN